MKTSGEVVRGCRKALAGMTQDQLGRVLGVSAGIVSKWERDRCLVPARAVAFCRALRKVAEGPSLGFDRRRLAALLSGEGGRDLFSAVCGESALAAAIWDEVSDRLLGQDLDALAADILGADKIPPTLGGVA